jgi:rhodanese-related sulfurtransferase
MGPLVPFGIISPEFNYIVALFIGFGFGWVLEQAGFSTSRKLVGVFYGYDYVVLRVFFTAAATAAIGLVALDYLGAIDFNYLYINPTFLWPAIAGGAIMGVGFIIGGFCPGTSVVAAAVGKVDAWLFIIGSFLGIIIYGELYPMFKDFYMSGNYGPIFVYDSLGISRGLFVFLLTFVAIAAFVITDRLEKRVTYGIVPNHPKYGRAIPAIVVGAIAALIIMLLPAQEEQFADIQVKDIEKIEYVTTEQAAFDIYNKINKFQFIDLRSEDEYKQFCMTNAVRMTLQDVSMHKYSSYFTNKLKTPVLYCNDEEMALKAYMIARDEGYTNVAVLRGGINKYREMIENPTKVQSAGLIGDQTSDFLTKFSTFIKSDTTLTKPKEKKKVEVKTVKVEGGC